MSLNLTPNSKIIKLKGVGLKTADYLQTMGLFLIKDLWFHFPIRYQDKTKFTKIENFITGQYFLSSGKVLKTEIRFSARRSLLVWIEDDNHIICLRFFYFSIALKNNFTKGASVQFYGEARYGNNGFEMIHPEFIIKTQSNNSLLDNKLTPIYSITKGIHQKTIQKLIKNSLMIDGIIHDILPKKYLLDYGFSSIKNCLLTIHCPDSVDLKSDDKLNNARDYLVFEELLAYNFVLQKIKTNRYKSNGFKIIAKGQLRQQCLQYLPFKLTNAQKRVTSEIIEDLRQAYPMQRLLQGDVGSGKTLVALLTALDCVESGGQCAFMVPTELLARQHFYNLQKLLEPMAVNCELLVSGLNTKNRQTTLKKITNGEANIIIGTHALIQSTVQFHHLTYIIIDEQHRFGVTQRTKLINKANNKNPNQLLMTATPIPRTLAMSFYAFLEYSVIDELPPGRMAIATSSLHENKRDILIERLNNYCQSGKQVYWVCPLIEESEALQCQTANQTFEELQNKLPHLKIGLVHGQIKNKSEIMLGFKDKSLDILVATTVIEVGVDVPNASLMIIDNSERLGLSQLHQLRGRVGRGNQKSQCILLYKTPLSANAKARISIMRKTNDGFKIAERDLGIRGPGELLGTAQTGEIKFKLADFSKDQKIIQKIIKISHKSQCNSQCQLRLIERWGIQNLVF